MSKNRMLINYVPGVECRVAVVRDGRLEELHAERMDAASHVGNIYVGKVMNVEPGIQAAFVDFGLEENGFLHVTDVHPRYFPGEDDDATERVGRKTPRSERPPIQACLKRGQEIIVQVLKEGIGTKGPTLTSYLSIPGRFLVMMPQMDKVGVSRRVEDEEQRREMREILDQLELPDNFGFILRTAGMDQTKAELKRDLAYLQRLWKDMQKRMATGSKPRLLYAESDLLVRCLRDVLTADTEEVIVDEVAALRRAASFLKIVAPRTGPRLLRYADPCPIFHRFGVESQVRMVAQRETPLPSGGSLVIDETEAMVAIDVNSGKMRDNRDAETTAFKTNLEAADEIARQLRLRDLGGVVMNDFIDMRSKKNQRELMERFESNLKRDRAHTKALPPSAFGVVEMTRQRMRGSFRTVHTAECPHCRGLGRMPKPGYVLGDAMRELSWLLHFPQVGKVEMVLPPRLAGELLSGGRQRLSRMERQSGKHVDVRVSETAPMDRVSFYAYDERGADLELDRLSTPKPPDELEVWHAPSGEDASDWASDPGAEAEELSRHESEIEAEAARMADEQAGASLQLETADDYEPEDNEWGMLEAPAKRGRRRRGRSGAGGAPQPSTSARPPQQPRHPQPAGSASGAGGSSDGAEGVGGKKKRRRRRRRGRGGGEGQPLAGQPGAAGGMNPGGAPRADSWDIEPGALTPSTGQRAAANPGATRADSWDIEPPAPARRQEQPQRPAAPRPATPGVARAATDADSWDVAPAELHQAGSAPNRSGTPDTHAGASGDAGAPGKKKRRRRRRRGRGEAVGAAGDIDGESPLMTEPKPGTGPRPSLAPAASASDSWDIAPAELPPTPPRSVAPPTPVVTAAHARADSWDVAPAELPGNIAQPASVEVEGADRAPKKRRRRGGRGRGKPDGRSPDAAGGAGDAGAHAAGTDPGGES